MKYLVLSDSHGNVDNMVRAVEREKPDGIIHLGDCWRDAEELHELFPRLPLEQVPGNCDFGRFEALERVLILDDHRVLIAHGHTMGVKTGLLRAQYRALEQNADLLLFGHTHVPLVAASDVYKRQGRCCSTPARSAIPAGRPTACWNVRMGRSFLRFSSWNKRNKKERRRGRLSFFTYTSRNRWASVGASVCLRQTTFSSCTPVSGGQEKRPNCVSSLTTAS